MIVLYIVLIILALLVATMLFTKMSLIIKVVKPANGNFKSELMLSVLGQTIDLSPFIKQDKKTGEQMQAAQKKPKREEEKPSFGERLHKLRINIERGRYTYLLSKRYVRKKIKIENIDFNMKFGLDDAAHTGIATGAAWGSLYNVFGFVSLLFKVKSHKFNITPVFDGECFALEFGSRIEFSLSNILAIAFAVMINYIKAKIKIK